jgi:hypothetical protein
MKEINCKVLDNLSVNIKINENPYDIPVSSVFSIAARNNPKRSYLFVSKLIGKHIPVRPIVPFTAGYLLASRLAEYMGLTVNRKKIKEAVSLLSCEQAGDFQPVSYELSGKSLFIGFAETATALGHAVYDCFKGNACYLHTTREDLRGTVDTIFFTEAHCHAPEQRCLVCDASLFTNNDLLVLIDDEITTGNTCLNFIKTIQEKYPQKHYIILTILDWRSKEAKEKYALFEQELGIKLEVISLYTGSFGCSLSGSAEKEQLSPVNIAVNGKQVILTGEKSELSRVISHNEPIGRQINLPGRYSSSYLQYTGRFGINIMDSDDLRKEASRLGKKLSQLRRGEKTLCLGTGEFMYIPFLIAAGMGPGIAVQSTTRSPVQAHLRQGYAVQYAVTFTDPFRPNIKNFVYNIKPFYYDEVFVFWEREVKPEAVAVLVQSLNGLGIERIVFVSHCR